MLHLGLSRSMFNVVLLLPFCGVLRLLPLLDRERCHFFFLLHWSCTMYSASSSRRSSELSKFRFFVRKRTHTLQHTRTCNVKKVPQRKRIRLFFSFLLPFSYCHLPATKHFTTLFCFSNLSLYVEKNLLTAPHHFFLILRCGSPFLLHSFSIEVF